MISIPCFSTGPQKTRYLNLDFEMMLSDQTPKYWRVSGQGFTLVVDKEIKKSGKSSLRIEGKKTGKNIGVAKSIFPLSAARGKKFRLSGYIKTEALTKGYAGMWLRVDGKNGKQLFLENMKKFGISGTNDWKRYSIKFDVPEDAIKISMGVLMSGTGKAWFDDLKITLDGELYQQTPPAIAVPVPGSTPSAKKIR